MVYAVCDECHKYFHFKGSSKIRGRKCPNCGRKGRLHYVSRFHTKGKSLIVIKEKKFEGDKRRRIVF
ncbi:MAG: hypothetical protein QXU81_00055 [Candidatus Bathyarchaeia archaeon]